MLKPKKASTSTISSLKSASKLMIGSEGYRMLRGGGGLISSLVKKISQTGWNESSVGTQKSRGKNKEKMVLVKELVANVVESKQYTFYSNSLLAKILSNKHSLCFSRIDNFVWKRFEICSTIAILKQFFFYFASARIKFN